MFPILLNPLPVLLTFSTMLGVLVHDSRIDRAAYIASIPQTASIHAELKTNLKLGNLHTHAERAGFSRSAGSANTSEPTMRPRDEDDNKYVIQKKLNANSYGSVYSWPSL